MPGSFDRGISFEMNIARDFCFRYNSRILGDIGFYSRLLGAESCVDVLMFSKKGLFVIEAKSFKTALRGKINDGFWLGTTGRTTTRIYNTYLQNLLHVRLVLQFLRRNGLDVPRVFNVILVPDGCVVESDYGGVMTLAGFHAWYPGLPDVWNGFSEVCDSFGRRKGGKR